MINHRFITQKKLKLLKWFVFVAVTFFLSGSFGIVFVASVACSDLDIDNCRPQGEDVCEFACLEIGNCIFGTDPEWVCSDIPPVPNPNTTCSDLNIPNCSRIGGEAYCRELCSDPMLGDCIFITSPAFSCKDNPFAPHPDSNQPTSQEECDKLITPSSLELTCPRDQNPESDECKIYACGITQKCVYDVGNSQCKLKTQQVETTPKPESKPTTRPLSGEELLAGLSSRYDVPTEGPLAAVPCAVKGTCDDVNDLVTLLIGYGQVLFSIIGALAFVMFVVGGFTMILSFGNAERFKKGQQILLAAVTGLIISLSAYVLVDFILDGIGLSDYFRSSGK